MKKNLKLSLCALTLAVTTAFSMGGASVNAAEPVSSIEQGGLNLTKTAKLEDDGTYTLNLEAFATGTTVTSVATKPADVVLVLDVSGSMDENITYVTEETYTNTHKQIPIKDKRTDNLYHKCPDGTYSTIHWTDSGSNGTGTYRYICDNCLATRKHEWPLSAKIEKGWDLYTYGSTNVTQSRIDALKNAANLFIDGVAEKNAVITDESMKHRVSVVKFADDSYGADNQNTFNNQNYNHTQIVQTMTSDMQANKNAINALSAAGATAADYGMNKAEAALAGTSADRDKIVILFTDGEPNHSNGFNNDVANSAIAKAKTLKDAGTTIYTIGIFNGADPNGTSNVNKYMNYVSTNYPSATSLASPGTGSNKGYYKVASDTKALNNIFKEISSSVGTTSVELTSDAVMKDIIGEGFVTTANTTASAYTVDYKGRDRSGNREFNDTTKTSVNAEITGSTVTVTGFDYKANCLIDGTSYDNNDFLAAKQGKKLVLEIKGVEATDAAISDVVVNTNGIDSGIYKNASATTPDARFPMPKTKVNSKAYVLDYAKEASLTDMETTTHLDADGMNKFETSDTNLGLTYGDVTTSSYVPKTMNWDGYDTYYAFGKTTPATGVTTGDNAWTKVSVLPATSVYYEDDFVTDSNGTVGIEYTGEWTVDGTASGNTEEANNPVQGWIESLGDDVTYSDGTAHVSSTAGATATFTFTGTGVDVYSRTDMETGTVLVTLKETNSASTAVNKILVVDNKAKDGEYYQIPTVFFNNLNYGTYTVTIKVTNAAANDGGRKTYYLDGIRVYNPLNPENMEDETINSAYAEQNTKVTAMFTSVRDLLIQDTSATTVDGAVFIDENAAGTTEKTSDLAVYEELGPKNEVYLAAGQSIVFQACDSETPIYIGLKAPKGETKAAFTKEDGAVGTTITSPADLYYQVVPNAAGMVTVKNTGSNLLSITKICVPDIMEATGTYIATMNVEDAVSYANTFAALPCSEYKANAIAETEITNPDQNAGDVEIDNGTVDDNMTKPATPALNWVKNLFNALRKWFN